MGVVSSSIVSIISGVGAVIRSTLQLASDLTVGVFNIAIAFLEFSKKLLKGIFNGLIVLFGGKWEGTKKTDLEQNTQAPSQPQPRPQPQIEPPATPTVVSPAMSSHSPTARPLAVPPPRTSQEAAKPPPAYSPPR
ncbi:hypothetical protein BT69DRAFT_1330639 [Atractiella rhizophila]|nr:hypothetical protein BT69DRAFT_1330639 [Atractiella rhizophila]